MSEARRLDERMKAISNIAAFCREHGKPLSPAMIYQHRKGLKPISLDAAVVYARAFGCALDDISPRLAAMVAAVPIHSGAGYPTAKITRLQTAEPSNMLEELTAMCDGINERGLAELIGAARVIAKNHPRQTVKNLRS